MRSSGEIVCPARPVMKARVAEGLIAMRAA
jgi:hypothetical protein